jgi:hypothetical protein
MEVWKYGNMEIWKYGNMEIWKYGNIELWNFGIMELWQLRIWIWSYGHATPSVPLVVGQMPSSRCSFHRGSQYGNTEEIGKYGNKEYGNMEI